MKTRTRRKTIRPPVPRRWTLALALCTLLGCTFSVPGLASGADSDAGQEIVSQTQTTLGTSVAATPGVDAPPDEATLGATATSTGDAPPDAPAPLDDATAAASVVTTDGAAVPPETPSPMVSVGRLLVTLPWGDGPGEVGLVHVQEGLSRGPEALAVAPDGRIVILDSVNHRLVSLDPDGAYRDTWGLELSEPRFLAAEARGVYVLDCDADRELVCLDWSGTEWARFALPPLDEVVTALLATDIGPCIETGHDQVFLVDLRKNLSKSVPTGQAVLASLQGIAGRPLDKALQGVAKLTFSRSAGLRMRSFRLERATLKATLLGTAEPRLTSRQTLEHLVSLDPVAPDGLVIGARLIQTRDPGASEPAVVLARLSMTQDGRVRESAQSLLYLNDRSLAYVGLPYVVAPDGRVLQPKATAEGYSLLVHRFPAPSADPLSSAVPEEAIP